jgi:hypothetical protein
MTVSATENKEVSSMLYLFAMCWLIRDTTYEAVIWGGQIFWDAASENPVGKKLVLYVMCWLI